MESIEVVGIGKIKIRRSSNIKYLSVRMAPGRGVWVNVPYGVSGRQVLKFLEEKKAWIGEHSSHMKTYEQKTGVGLRIGAEVKTKKHTLKIAEALQKVPTYRMEGENITLFIPSGTVYEKIEGLVKNFLLEIYRMESKQILPSRVKYWAEKYGFVYTSLSFRNNLSNWGSCSYDNRIILNIKLMKLPDEVIDYVILHELAHTVEKNHSGTFWALVKKICPDFEKKRRMLKEYNTRV